METIPSFVLEKNTCEWLAAWIPSIAGLSAPEVPFLIPIGQDKPDASSLCI